MKEVILISGITGFLGSHLGKVLIEMNYQVVATRRTTSSLENCFELQEVITWINMDDELWKEKVIALQPQLILHAAWIGVSHQERNDWELQCKNVYLLQDLLYIAQQSSTKKIIGLGSQAEYGLIDTVAVETNSLMPATAYAALKIINSQLIKNHCMKHNMQWYWLRIFSVFGEKESTQWLLPSLIERIIRKQTLSMAFSPGEQQYAYLYIKDFAKAITKVVTHKNDNSGFYNISSTEILPLKTMITFIRDMTDPNFKLEFGALPYRQHQSMLMAGDMSLFNETFGSIQITPLKESINNTINFYTSKVLNESI